MLPRFHWGSVISLADGVFFNEECNYLNRSAKDAQRQPPPPLRLLLLLLLLPASPFPTHLRGSSCKKKKERKRKDRKYFTALSATVFLPPSVSTSWMRLVLCHRRRLDGTVSVSLIKWCASRCSVEEKKKILILS